MQLYIFLETYILSISIISVICYKICSNWSLSKRFFCVSIYEFKLQQNRLDLNHCVNSQGKSIFCFPNKSILKRYTLPYKLHASADNVFINFLLLKGFSPFLISFALSSEIWRWTESYWFFLLWKRSQWKR